MICRLFTGMATPWGEWTCRGTGLAVDIAGYVTSAVVVLVLGWVAVSLARYASGRDPRRPIATVLVGSLMALAAVGLLGAAATGPALVPVAGLRSGHLVIVLDGSESVLRQGRESNAAQLGGVAGALERSIRDRGIDPGRWTASLVRFGRTAETVFDGVALQTALETLRRPIDGATADPEGSNPGPALRRALELIATRRTPGLIALVSDGHWTEARAMSAVEGQLLSAGIPVMTLPVFSPRPRVGLTESYLPRLVEAGEEVVARLMVTGEGRLKIVSRRSDSSTALPVRDAAIGAAVTPVRLPERFAQQGIQYLELEITTLGQTDRRRLYTTVTAPPHILALGAAPWLDMLKDRFRISRQVPTEPIDARAYDLVVVEGLDPSQVHPETPARLQAGVLGHGLGFMLVNGRMRGAPDQSTVVELWEKSVVGGLLPVGADQRKIIPDPPPRDVSILIDSSGSMGATSGGLSRLDRAKLIGKRIVELSRPQDRLQIIGFTTVAIPHLPLIPMDEGGKARARQALDGIPLGGGTEITAAVGLVRQMTSNTCAVFILSDGDFPPPNLRPGCATVVFEIDEDEQIGHPEHRSLADELISFGPRSSTASIRPRFFKPDERTEKFRTDTFRPLHVGDDKRRPITPDLDVQGVAITYPRPEAERISTHPKWPFDPVLAFRDAGKTQRSFAAGQVGVFTGDTPAQWIGSGNAAARIAVVRALEELIAWSERDRYDIAFSEQGGEIEVRITALARNGRAIGGVSIEADMECEGRTEGLQLRRLDDAPGVFVGRFPLPRGEAAGPVDAMLRIRETGATAFSRPQVLPMRLPRAGATTAIGLASEAMTYGVNVKELERIAVLTGGRYIADMGNAPAVDAALPRPVETPVDHLLIAFASVLLVLAVVLGAGRP